MYDTRKIEDYVGELEAIADNLDNGIGVRVKAMQTLAMFALNETLSDMYLHSISSHNTGPG